MKTPTLKTRRLILRPISLDDAPAVQKYFNDWNIIKYISTAPWPYPEDGALSHIRNTVLPAMEHGFAWAITLKGNDEAIGILSYGLKTDDKNNDRGFWLAVKYHGQGLMTEAVACTNDFIFGDLGVKRFSTRNVKGNIGSRRIKEKTGGILIGEKQEHFTSGKEETMELWEITKESWIEARKKLKL